MRVMGDHALCRHLLEGAVSLFLPLFLLDILFNMPSANVLRLHVLRTDRTFRSNEVSVKRSLPGASKQIGNKGEI
jgi:hypothetical protein